MSDVAIQSVLFETVFDCFENSDQKLLATFLFWYPNLFKVLTLRIWLAFIKVCSLLWTIFDSKNSCEDLECFCFHAEILANSCKEIQHFCWIVWEYEQDFTCTKFLILFYFVHFTAFLSVSSETSEAISIWNRNCKNFGEIFQLRISSNSKFRKKTFAPKELCQSFLKFCENFWTELKIFVSRKFKVSWALKTEAVAHLVNLYKSRYDRMLILVWSYTCRIPGWSLNGWYMVPFMVHVSNHAKNCNIVVSVSSWNLDLLNETTL